MGNIPVQIQLFVLAMFHQSKRGAGDGAGNTEQKKFSGVGYDINLVESLERDIVSRNPSVHWYGGPIGAHGARSGFVSSD